MRNSFICGSFQHQEEGEDTWSSSSKGSSPSSTPRKTRKSNNSPFTRSRKSSSKNNKNSNPYSSRGLDKFSALVADLEQRRQQIYAQMGSRDHEPLVRFVYRDSDDVVPIVIKLKDRNNQGKTKTSDGQDAIKENPRIHRCTEFVDKLPKETSVPEKEIKQSRLETEEKVEKKRPIAWNFKLHRWRRPSYYMPVALLFILVLLAFFGRSFAILCTSIGWYIVPTLSSKGPTNKKTYVKRFSNIKVKMNDGLHSPRSSISTGAVKDA